MTMSIPMSMSMSMPMSMLNVHSAFPAACPSCMFMLHVPAACSCPGYMSILRLQSMSRLHVYWLSILDFHFQTACPCPRWMSTSQCCMNMLHGQGHGHVCVHGHVHRHGHGHRAWTSTWKLTQNGQCLVWRSSRAPISFLCRWGITVHSVRVGKPSSGTHYLLNKKLSSILQLAHQY